MKMPLKNKEGETWKKNLILMVVFYNKRDDYTKETASIVSKRQERNVFLTIFAIYYKGSNI